MIKRLLLFSSILFLYLGIFLAVSPLQNKANALACSITTYTEKDFADYACVSSCPAKCSSAAQDTCYQSCNNCGNSFNAGCVYNGVTCPTFRSTCTSHGVNCPVTTPWSCSNDSCGGSGSCTFNNYSCGASVNTCSHTSTQYSTNCGGATISGTNMCSNWSHTCSPPAPAVTLTTSCNGTTPQIVANRTNNVSHSDGNYDLRWRKSGGSFTNVCSPTNPHIITGLANSTAYEVQVRGNTTAGYNGPTNFSSDTITTPNCTPTPCNSGIVCGACTATSGTCGPGTQTCNYTTSSGGGACTPIPAPNQSCTVGCPSGSSCISNACVCDTPAAPTNVLPSGSISVGTRNITWQGVSGITTYALRVDDLSNGWTGTCSSVNPGDVCNNNVTSTSYSYNFQSGHSYSIWVHAIAACGTYSAATSTSVTVGSDITINVYQDLNSNGIDDGAAETPYSGATITVTGQGAGTYTTNASGQVVLSNVQPGGSTITLTAPSGFTSTTTNPRTVTLPPSQTVNFGIQPPAPTCGTLSATPNVVNPGVNSSLVINCNLGGQGGTLTYNWFTDTGAVSPVITAVGSSTYVSPNPWWTQVIANPSVQVCQTGTSLCTARGTTIQIVPLFSASGNVFVDQNKDQLQNGPDTNYTGGISISPNPTGVTVTYPTPGNYVISNMPGGTYTISYTGLPVGYQMTYPRNGPPPSFTVTVGNASTGGACGVSGHNSASCDANGNITTLRYGISNSIPWIQSTGGDITGNDVTDPTAGGFTNSIPAGASCGTYVSLTGTGGTPGVIYAGAGSYNFGSGQASQNPYNWVIGGLTYPDTYIPSTPGLIRTSYPYMRSLASQSNLTPVDIATYCGAGGISNCTLSGSIPNGLYIVNGDLTLTGASYTFPANRNFVILVNGNLNINTEVHVPVGSTALFTVSGDINVASTVGEAVITSTRANVEGYYSTDRNFNVLGINSCPTVDRRLNVEGSIVVNAALSGGSFVNQRDLCAGDLQCPVFMVIERPDFVLNSPEFLKSGRRVWREIAP